MCTGEKRQLQKERERESLFQAVASLISLQYWLSFEFQTLLSLEQVIEGDNDDDKQIDFTILDMIYL